MDVTATLVSLESPTAPEVLELGRRVRGHAVFGALASAASVRTFMEHHVWAVWDFMSLLQAIAAGVAPHRTPWTPPRDAELARFVHEIVLGEETDTLPDGTHASHFETYVRAMDAAGADARPIRRFVEALASGTPWRVALDLHGPCPTTRAFVAATLETVERGLPETVAAFTLGREDVIPDMFRAAVAHLDAAPAEGCDLGLLRWYLERHIEIDGDHHGPLAARLFERVCRTDRVLEERALRAAAGALEHRLALWDATLAAISR